MKYLLPLCLLLAMNVSGANPDVKAFNTNQFDATLRSISIKNGGVHLANLNEDVLNYFTAGTSGTNGVNGTDGVDGTNGSNANIELGLQIYGTDPGNGEPTLVWWDFGLTNDSGERLIYQSISATNSVVFLGATNAQVWRLISMNVLASGADRRIYFPANLTHLDTNGLVLGSGFYASNYYLTLTNGHELRVSVQSNALTLSTLWYTPEQ